MTPTIIKGFNLLLRPPALMKDCGHLHARHVATPDGKIMQSAWLPSADELAALNAGGSVVLTICGNSHPPVSLSVEPISNED